MPIEHQQAFQYILDTLADAIISDLWHSTPPNGATQKERIALTFHPSRKMDCETDMFMKEKFSTALLLEENGISSSEAYAHLGRGDHVVSLAAKEQKC